MSANHKATSKQLLELWGDNAVHQASEFLSADYVNHQMPDASDGTSDLSQQDWKDLVRNFHQGFADVNMEILMQGSHPIWWTRRRLLPATRVHLLPSGRCPSRAQAKLGTVNQTVQNSRRVAKPQGSTSLPVEPPVRGSLQPDVLRNTAPVIAPKISKTAAEDSGTCAVERAPIEAAGFPKLSFQRV